MLARSCPMPYSQQMVDCKLLYHPAGVRGNSLLLQGHLHLPKYKHGKPVCVWGGENVKCGKTSIFTSKVDESYIQPHNINSLKLRTLKSMFGCEFLRGFLIHIIAPLFFLLNKQNITICRSWTALLRGLNYSSGKQQQIFTIDSWSFINLYSSHLWNLKPVPQESIHFPKLQLLGR